MDITFFFFTFLMVLFCSLKFYAMVLFSNDISIYSKISATKFFNKKFLFIRARNKLIKMQNIKESLRNN